jgi:hypothetical protein
LGEPRKTKHQWQNRWCSSTPKHCIISIQRARAWMLFEYAIVQEESLSVGSRAERYDKRYNITFWVKSWDAWETFAYRQRIAKFLL